MCLVALWLLFVVNGYYSYMYEKIAENVDWSIDSVGSALGVSFSPSSYFQMKHMQFLTQSHIERYSFGDIDFKPRRIYKVESPSINYTMIYENHEVFVTLHSIEMNVSFNDYSEVILWSAISGNRLSKLVINKRILTYACKSMEGGANSVQLFLLTDDLNLQRVDLLSGSTVFNYYLPLLNVGPQQLGKSHKLQAMTVNYQTKIFLYYLQNNQIMVSELSVETGEPKTLVPYSSTVTHDIDIDLSRYCYLSTYGLACFIQQCTGNRYNSYVFTVNRDNYQHQLRINDSIPFVARFHSNSILELYTVANNTLKYVFYADGIIANITNQIPEDCTNVIVMQSDDTSTQNIQLAFASMINTTTAFTNYQLTIYELQFEERRIEFLLVYETLLKYSQIVDSNYRLRSIKYVLLIENNAYNLFVLCQHFDLEDNQLLQLFHNGKLHWSSESNLGDIINILPIEIKERRKINIDENMAYQSNSFISRLFYRLKIGYSSLAKCFIQFGTHFGLTRRFTVYKNYRHSTILLVTTSKSYIYGIYSKNGQILWRYKLSHFSPFNTNSFMNYSLPIYLISKAEVKGGVYHSSVAAVVGKAVEISSCQTMIWVFDPLTGNPIINNKFINSVDTTHFSSLASSSPGLYALIHDGNNINKCQPLNILQLANTLVFATSTYDDIFVFPTHTNIESKPDVSFDIVYQQGQSIVGSTVSLNKIFKSSKTDRWIINVPIIASRIKIHSFSSEYYTDKSKMVFNSRHYKPLNLKNFVVVSYVTVQSSSNKTSTSDIIAYVVNVVFVDKKTGKVVKGFIKKNILDPDSVVINLVSNVCTIISTNYRSKVSTVSVVGFYYESREAKNKLSEEYLLFLAETYLLGAYKVVAATTTTTNFGFSHKSLILSLHNGRLWAIPYSLLDPRRNYKSNITDSATIIAEYFPQVEQYPTNIINKNHNLLNVSGIITFPSHIESTSIVCAASLNGLYCSHLVGLHGTPFDILSVNFDHYFVVVFIVALFIVLWFSRSFHLKKNLYNQWL